MAAKKGLGKGLDSLITDKVAKPAVAEKKLNVDAVDGAIVLDINKVEPNRDQPRKNFDEDELLELSDSIKKVGVLQPLLVRQKDDYYEIIGGERRWRASKMAGLDKVPVVVMNDFSEQQILEVSLIENIQRADLDPIEEAQAYKRLMTEFGLKQDEVAEKVSKSRVAVTNSIRLLKLNEKVQQMVVAKMISTGHARALLGIEDADQQYAAAQKIFDEKLSVRDTEKLVKNLQNEKKDAPAEKKKLNPQLEAVYQNLEEQLKGILGTKVSIAAKSESSGKIEIEYFSSDELDRIIDLIRTVNK